MKYTGSSASQPRKVLLFVAQSGADTVQMQPESLFIFIPQRQNIIPYLIPRWYIFVLLVMFNRVS